jgi:hypothetical protein
MDRQSTFDTADPTGWQASMDEFLASTVCGQGHVFLRVNRGEPAFSRLNGHSKTTVEESARVGWLQNPRF